MNTSKSLIQLIGFPTLLVAGLTFTHYKAAAQCKSFTLSDRGDTLNCIDQKNRKQGKWAEKTLPLRGNPGFTEEGIYLNGTREGLWRKYNLSGDAISMENYKWGLLNGTSQYFTVEGLEREENWKALDPTKKFDTIDVPDLYKEGVYKKVVVKNEGYSMKHGKWTFYEPRTGFIKSTEAYFYDSLSNPLASFGVKNKPKNDSTAADYKKRALLEKTQEIKEWEKKNAGKKKIKTRDGSTGY